MDWHRPDYQTNQSHQTATSHSAVQTDCLFAQLDQKLTVEQPLQQSHWAVKLDRRMGSASALAAVVAVQTEMKPAQKRVSTPGRKLPGRMLVELADQMSVWHLALKAVRKSRLPLRLRAQMLDQRQMLQRAELVARRPVLVPC